MLKSIKYILFVLAPSALVAVINFLVVTQNTSEPTGQLNIHFACSFGITIILYTIFAIGSVFIRNERPEYKWWHMCSISLGLLSCIAIGYLIVTNMESILRNDYAFISAGLLTLFATACSLILKLGLPTTAKQIHTFNN